MRFAMKTAAQCLLIDDPGFKFDPEKIIWKFGGIFDFVNFLDPFI